MIPRTHTHPRAIFEYRYLLRMGQIVGILYRKYLLNAIYDLQAVITRRTPATNLQCTFNTHVRRRNRTKLQGRWHPTHIIRITRRSLFIHHAPNLHRTPNSIWKIVKNDVRRQIKWMKCHPHIEYLKYCNVVCSVSAFPLNYLLYFFAHSGPAVYVCTKTAQLTHIHTHQHEEFISITFCIYVLSSFCLFARSRYLSLFYLSPSVGVSVYCFLWHSMFLYSLCVGMCIACDFAFQLLSHSVNVSE